MFDFDKAVEIALRTWYPNGHPLHLETHHPLGKLIGEFGELLDDYMKSVYKPEYKFEPLDELGDIWYYLRILCYQIEDKPYLLPFPKTINDTDWLLAYAMSKALSKFLYSDQKPSIYTLANVYSVILALCDRYNITLEQLTQSNWEKLKPGSERGKQWMKAREK